MADTPKKAANPATGSRDGVAKWSRKNRAPVILLSVDGKPANDLLRLCTKFTFKRCLGKSTECSITFRNDTRTLLDDKRLFPNQTWKIRFGYWDDLSPVHEMIIRLVDPDYGMKATVTVTLFDSLLNASTKSSGKNWGKVSSTTVAKAIAKKNGWKFSGDDSKDVPTKSWIQPNDVNDVRFIRDLAAMVDFEVFLDGSPPTLFYRKKQYESGPKGILTYFDDPSEDSYVKRFNPKVKSLGPVQAGVASTDAEKGKGKKGTVDKPKGASMAVYVNLGDKTPTSRDLVIAPASAKKDVSKPAPSNSDTKRLAEVARQQMLDKCNEADSDHPLTPSLSAGSIYEWRGIDKQVNGKWYVYEETHSISGNSSDTKISWKRNATNKGNDKNNNVNNKKSDGALSKNAKIEVVAGRTGAEAFRYIPPGVSDSSNKSAR